VVKSKLSTGYDLTQLMIGSEGSLALATEVTVRLYPLLAHAATLLVPFPDLPRRDAGGARGGAQRRGARWICMCWKAIPHTH
jgi:FAD/FMN-containing dehydrogenase